MFDLSFSELLVIGVVALLVLGPQKLPKVARMAGLWMRKARAQWYSVRAEFEREMEAEELRESLKKQREELASLEQSIKRPFQEVDSLASSHRSADDPAKNPPSDETSITTPSEKSS